MLDLNKTGPCSTHYCKNRGKRARGARDISALAERVNALRPGTILKSFYCEGCVSAASIRVHSSSIAVTARRKRNEEAT